MLHEAGFLTLDRMSYGRGHQKFEDFLLKKRPLRAVWRLGAGPWTLFCFCRRQIRSSKTEWSEAWSSFPRQQLIAFVHPAVVVLCTASRTLVGHPKAVQLRVKHHQEV